MLGGVGGAHTLTYTPPCSSRVVFFSALTPLILRTVTKPYTINFLWYECHYVEK